MTDSISQQAKLKEVTAAIIAAVPRKRKPSETPQGKETHGLYRHGMCRSRQYGIWRGMINRCYRKQELNYHRYGGKGIRVCREWREDFLNFWDDMKAGYFSGATLDRINNSNDYSPSNCRWVTKADQNRNKSNVQLYWHCGAARTIPEIAAMHDMKHETLYARLKTYGWTLERALSQPVK